MKTSEELEEEGGRQELAVLQKLKVEDCWKRKQQTL